MTTPGSNAAARWRAEVLDRLVGALYGRRRRELLDSAAPATVRDQPPVYLWWLFEGQDWQALGGPLADRWPELARSVRTLLATHNPRLRETDHPSGDIDWPRTLSRGPSLDGSAVVRGSQIGLGDGEREALLGWLGLVLQNWATFARDWRITPEHPVQEALHTLSALTAGRPALPPRSAQWVRVATRSRWPLLRELVAQSLRALDEPRAHIALPLPEADDRLFELLVLIRVAEALGADWSHIRWFTQASLGAAGDRHVRFNGFSVVWEHHFTRRAVLDASLEPALAEAVEVWQLRVHHKVDLLFDLHSVEASPFRRIVVEVKSGQEDAFKGLWQLRAYGLTLVEAHPCERVLAICVAEKAPPLTPSQRSHVAAQAQGSAQVVWAFCGPDEVGLTLRAAGVGASLPR